MGSPVKAVFLDAAHTILKLVRPYPEMLSAGLAAFGFRVPAPEAAAVLDRCWRRVEHLFLGDTGEYTVDDEWDRRMWHDFYRMMLAELQIADYPPELLDAIYDQFAEPSNWELYPEVPETLRRLKEAGFTVGIGSNWDSSLPDILAGLGVAEMVDVTVVSALVGCRKPGRGFFEAECAAVGLPPEEVAHVGDHPVADAKGAVESGLRSVLVWRDGSVPPAIPRVAVIRSLAELPAVL